MTNSPPLSTICFRSNTPTFHQVSLFGTSFKTSLPFLCKNKSPNYDKVPLTCCMIKYLAFFPIYDGNLSSPMCVFKPCTYRSSEMGRGPYFRISALPLLGLSNGCIKVRQNLQFLRCPSAWGRCFFILLRGGVLCGRYWNVTHEC